MENKINLLFIDKNWGNKITGPTVWRDALLSQLKNKNNVSLITLGKNPIKNIYLIFSNLHNILHCEVVQTHVSTFPIISLCFFLKVIGKKHVHMLHGDYFAESKDKGNSYILRYNLILKLANTVVFPTNYLKNNILPKVKLSANFCVIPPGIVYLKKKPAKITSVKNFLEITSFTRQEKCAGIKPLVEAFNEIKNKDDKLIIIGGGEHLEEYSTKYSSNNVIFLGRRNDVDEWIKKCDAFVHVSFLESFGIVILEAMNYRKPILTVNVQGIPESVGKGGLIVEPTKNEIKKGLLLLKNKKFGKTIENQKEHLEKLNWSLISKDFENVYKNLLKKTIFLVRHGETKYNIEKRITGQKNPPLTNKGILQAKRVGEYFSRIPFDKVYSSDLVRATETAKFISDEIVFDPLLRELSFGAFENKIGENLQKVFLNMDSKCAGGESLNELQLRLRNFLRKVSLDKTNVIVAHEGVNKMLKSILTNSEYGLDEHQANDEIIKISNGKAEKIKII